MSWAVWLAVPVVVTVVVATVVWLRARPAREPTAHQAMREHQRYLDALVTPARGRQRTDPIPDPAQASHDQSR